MGQTQSNLSVGVLLDALNGEDIADSSDRWSLFWQTPSASVVELFDATPVGLVRNVRSNNPRNFAKLINKVRRRRRRQRCRRALVCVCVCGVCCTCCCSCVLVARAIVRLRRGGCGGFESSTTQRCAHLGTLWVAAAAACARGVRGGCARRTNSSSSICVSLRR